MLFWSGVATDKLLVPISMHVRKIDSIQWQGGEREESGGKRRGPEKSRKGKGGVMEDQHDQNTHRELSESK